MSWRFTYLFLFIFLSGCIPAQSTQMPIRSADPIQAYVNANSSQATAVAAIATADYFSSQLTGTAEAMNQASTQQAQALQIQATERAWNATTTANAIQSTASASAIAQQAIWTQRAIDITSTADTAAVQAFATQQYAEARTHELALQRAELMNKVAAVVPWSVLICSVFVGFLVLLRWTRVRVIPRDPRGDAPLLLNVVDGVTYDADRHPTSTAGMQREDLKRLPQFSASDHTQTVLRDQMVDLATRSLPGETHRKNGAQDAAKKELLSSGSAPQIQVIEAGNAQPLFHDVIPEIVQDAIEADVIQEGNTP